MTYVTAPSMGPVAVMSSRGYTKHSRAGACTSCSLSLAGCSTNRILVKQPSDQAKPDIDWSSDVKEIKMPVLLAFGDADDVRTPHADSFSNCWAEVAKMADGRIRNVKCAVDDFSRHDALHDFSAPLLVSTVTQFLNGPMPKAASA